jgi:hypothetical protein
VDTKVSEEAVAFKLQVNEDVTKLYWQRKKDNELKPRKQGEKSPDWANTNAEGKFSYVFLPAVVMEKGILS